VPLTVDRESDGDFARAGQYGPLRIHCAADLHDGRSDGGGADRFEEVAAGYARLVAWFWTAFSSFSRHPALIVSPAAGGK
jgi:hypothetical protein